MTRTFANSIYIHHMITCDMIVLSATKANKHQLLKSVESIVSKAPRSKAMAFSAGSSGPAHGESIRW